MISSGIIGEKAEVTQMVLISSRAATGQQAVKPFCRSIGEEKIAVGEEIEQYDAAIKLAVMHA